MSKRNLLEARVCIYPGETTVFPLPNSTLPDSFPYFQERLELFYPSLEMVVDRSPSEYARLAVDKGFVDFGTSTKEGMFYLPKGVVIREPEGTGYGYWAGGVCAGLLHQKTG